MRRRVVWNQSAVEQIIQLSARNHRLATRLAVGLREFAQSSRGDLKKLSGSPDWRLRVGEWRVFLKLDGEIAWVLGLSDRQDAY